MPSEKAFIVVTAILDQTARPAVLTLKHGEAMERADRATKGHDIAGLDLVELPIPRQAFDALRKHIAQAPDTVAVYDLFPLASHLDPATRRVAGQFLAAEILWALEEQGHFKGVPLHIRLDVPPGWDRTPKALHERLVAAGALDLGERAINVFKAIKAAWDASF
jgi:hypothetical protein